MPREMKSYKTVDDYMAAQSPDVRKKLQELRQAILAASPEATEKISYGMPYYHLNGRLLYFMAHKEHIGFYPMKSAISAFKDELSGYETSAGTVRFPLDKPLPLPLINRIIKFRVK